MREILTAKAPMEPIPPDIIVIPGVNVHPIAESNPSTKPRVKGRRRMTGKRDSAVLVNLEPAFAEHIRDFCDRENITLGAFFTYAAKLLFERLDR